MECYSIHVSTTVKGSGSGADQEPTGGGRAPRFPKREERARRTRAAIRAAARGLFVADGYGGTTIQAIADDAGVAVQTVYATFGNKRAILAELLDVSIAGDDAPVVVNAREWMAPVFSAPTAEQRLRTYAAAVDRILDGAAPVFTVVAEAAASDPEIAELHETAEARRRAGAASVVDAARQVGRLKAGLTRSRAVDLVWLLNGPAVRNHLVGAAGWSRAAYVAWLADTLVDQLLGPG